MSAVPSDAASMPAPEPVDAVVTVTPGYCLVVRRRPGARQRVEQGAAGLGDRDFEADSATAVPCRSGRWLRRSAAASPTRAAATAMRSAATAQPWLRVVLSPPP